jgi:hypothetical protein
MDALCRTAGPTAHRATPPAAAFFRQLIASEQSFIGSEVIEGPGVQTGLVKFHKDDFSHFDFDGRF